MVDELINGTPLQKPKVTLADALVISRDIMAAVARLMSSQPDMALDVYIFTIHRALAGMAVVGYGMSHSKLPGDDEIEKLVTLYRAHLRDARTMEQENTGSVN